LTTTVVWPRLSVIVVSPGLTVPVLQTTAAESLREIAASAFLRFVEQEAIVLAERDYRADPRRA
jgi:hypothetical protein